MGFDLDDVVFMCLPNLIRRAIDLDLIPPNTRPGDISGRLEEQFGISPGDMERVLDADFFEGLEPFADVVSDIRGWIDDGEFVVFITSRREENMPGAEDATRNALCRCGLLDGSAGVFHRRSTTKWELARDLNLDVFVDDMPHVIQTMRDIIPHAFLLAIDHNRGVDGHMRRWSWDDVRLEIEHLRSIR